MTRAAEKAGIGRRTITRWMDDPAFQRDLRAARAKAFSLSMGRLCHLSAQAVDVLADLLKGEDVPKNRFLAACRVIEFAQAAATGDIQDRLDEIEDLITSSLGGAS